MPTLDDFALPVINPRPKSHLYGPDNPPPARGRLKGSVNRVTRDLKNGLLSAAEELGCDGEGTGGLIGYLKFLGLRHPKAFAGLLGRMLPLQVDANATGSVAIQQISVHAIPSGMFLTPESIAKINSGSLNMLEYEPQPEQPEAEPEPEPVIERPQLDDDRAGVEIVTFAPRRPGWP